MDQVRAQAEADKVAVWEEYEAWRKAKERDIRNGSIALVSSVIVGVTYALLAPKAASGTAASEGNGLRLFVWLVTLVLGTWGSFKVLDAKGRSRWLWFIGVLALALGDKNRREAPNKPMTGYRPEGSAFSDW